jgi:hypothetical protein
MNGEVGSGTVELKSAFTYNGVAYTCESGLQTWTVMRVGLSTSAPSRSAAVRFFVGLLALGCRYQPGQRLSWQAPSSSGGLRGCLAR